jgi:hypothetical protein
MVATEKNNALCAGCQSAKAKRRDRGNYGPNRGGGLVGLRLEPKCAFYSHVNIRVQSSFISAESEQLLFFNLQNCPLVCFGQTSSPTMEPKYHCGLRYFSLLATLLPVLDFELNNFSLHL